MSDKSNWPEWLKIACISDDSVIEVTPGGRVIFKGGEWEGGVWKDGVWKGGMWRGGVWEGGMWRGGVWRGGEWKDGVWRGGEWKDGVWEDGVWEGGEWRGGEWRGGYQSCVGRCKWRVSIRDEFIKIGCIEKKISDWDLWFLSDQTYVTPRNTDQFALIYAAYQNAKCLVEFNNKKKEEENVK